MIESIFQNSIASALFVIAGLTLLFGTIHSRFAGRDKSSMHVSAEQIDDLLPQTQCGQCGYPGCKPYAKAIAEGDAINKCPPGGQATINALADLLNVPSTVLDAEHGVESDVKK